MRFVIYDDESLEAITVVNLPITEKDIAERGWRWCIPVPPSYSIVSRDDNPPGKLDRGRIVEIWFEKFVRTRSSGERQIAWMAFTDATALAMLLDSDWLPGQLPAVNRLRDEAASLERLLGMLLR